MTHTAFVIPADVTAPGWTFEFENDAELYAQLYSALEAEVFDKTPNLPTPYGPIRMWVDDMATLWPIPQPENSRATTIAQGSHYLSPLAGTVVITGPPSPFSNGLGDDWQGLTKDHLDGFTWFTVEATRMHRYEMKRARVEDIARKMGDAIDARDAEQIGLLLADLRAISPEALEAGRLALALTAPEFLPRR